MQEELIIFCLALVLLSGCTHREKAVKEQSPLRVETMVIAPKAGIAHTRYVGTIEPVRETPLSMQTAGRVNSSAPQGDPSGNTLR